MRIRRNRLDGSICLNLARSLVSCNDFTTLLDICPPQDNHGGFRLESSGQRAIISVGVYLIESNLKDDENERPDVSPDPFGNVPNGPGTVTNRSSTRVDWCAWNNAWLEPNGSEYLFGQVASVYAGRLPHRAVLSDDYLSSCLTAPQLISLDRSGQLSGASEITSLSFTSNQMKALLKLVRSCLFI
ncbi:hypothetical protein EG68_00015 [Paragonimus skrjabini miyazakii]|uniref:Uncharacterized protein n=1 Tax=Paragonimus skrjabini miyazakii TaxID=59628 RepID=A0A8S9Z756_9TREM|nr:hypothetical protein EG68_00015 [Paragonimus skrjabini miyazakii]